MRPGTTPHSVSPIISFTGTTTSTALIQNDVAIAGVSKDGAVCWLVKEAILEVMDTRSSQCLSSWKFGEIICDPHAYITCVKEYQYGSSRRLLVGVCYSSSSGLLCILDLHLSKITRTIEIPQKISSLDPITNNGGDDVPVWALSAHLRHFYGIVAVGTNGGIVYLIDMCLDDEMESDEIKPNKLQFLSPRSRDTEQRRVQAMSRCQHLSMVLDEEAQGNGYKYRKCDGTVMKTFNTDAVHVSCLQYIPQIGSLFVGFSFGCYQIWKLHAPVLEYSSRLDVEMIPITHIAYQEPENDPKNFSYIWITRSTGDHQDDSLSTISLYQLAYNKKTMYSNYGAFYEDLSSVSLRFDLELTASPLNPNLKPTVSSRMITCYTLQDPCYKPPLKLDEEESFEESLHGPDLSLSVFVWECSDGAKQTSHMGIFDMNRWYHAQMPATVRPSSGPMDTCSYFSFLSLDEIAEHSEQGSVLAVYMSVDKLSRFTNTSLMPPEQHFYPSALAFNTVCVVDEGIVRAQYLGTQRQVMATMQKMGPSVLLNPKELYNLCVVVGLLPRPLDTTTSNPSPAQMKESLLTMALNYHMLSFITKCVQEWALGEFVHVGCSLKFLLDWVWSRVAEIKNSIDNSCVTLYDWSGIPLDRRALQTLYQANLRLGGIVTIIKALINQSAPTTEEGLGDLQDKLSVVTYIQQHLQMVIWFYKMGLLPERDEVEENEKQNQYPAGMLIQSYSQKRVEIQKLDSSIKGTDILMIDGMVEQMGEKIRDLWHSEGGNGLYPPCSLHALLSIYLLDDISLIDKHSVVLYALLDMVSLADPSAHDRLVMKVQKFSKKFGIPYTVVKQVQGFWLLDHKDFEESMSQILDPLVTLDFGRWQHQRIVKSLLYQGDSKMAARYLSTVQPSLSTPEEVKLKLTVLLANGFTAEALEYQRSCQDPTRALDLLQHIFHACQQTKTVDQLLQLPMSGREEETLVQFLTASSDQYCQEALILHYLQRACYVEAIRLNEKLKQTVMTDASAKARERATARNAIVDGFLSVLTNVQRKLVWDSYHCQKQPSLSRREVKRPRPLSTKVTTRNYSMQSRSSLYADVMNHVEEMESEQNMGTPNGTPEGISRKAFLGTPSTPKLNEALKPQPVVYPDINMSAWQNTSVSFNTSSLTPIRSKMKVQGASALRLLQTPKVERKTPRKTSRPSSSAPTPQSILKVRNLINSSTKLDSPDTSNKDFSIIEAPSAKKLGFSEESMAVSPSIMKTSPKVSHLANSNSVQGTPKKLRFAMEEDEDTEQESPKKESLVSSAKKLRFSDKGAKASSIKAPGSPTSSKSVLTRTPIRPLKERSPTPESISMSPKNRSKLDKLNHSSRASVSEEEETASKNNQEDIEMEEDAFFSPALQNVADISAIKSMPKEMEGASSNPSEFSPTPVVTTFSKGRFTQLKNSPHKASPKKLAISSVCRSPTVKLSQERTALFSDKETIKASDEEVSTTTEVKEPVQIDLTMDEDTEEEAEEEAAVQSGQDVELSVEQVKDRTLVSAADSSVDNIHTYAFAPPASTSDFPPTEKRSFQRLRSKHQFTFSPPVQVESSEQKDEGCSFDFSKTAEADSTSEMKTDNMEVFSTMNGMLDSSHEDGIKRKESRIRRGNLRSQKFKFSLKSPPSEQKLSGKKISSSSKVADGSFLEANTEARSTRSHSQSLKEPAKTKKTPRTAKSSEKESSAEEPEDMQIDKSDIPDSETRSENEDNSDKEKSQSRRGRTRAQKVDKDKKVSDKESKFPSVSPSSRDKSRRSSKSPNISPSHQTSRRGSNSPSVSPSTRGKSSKGSKSPSSSPLQRSAKATSRSRSESQEKVARSDNLSPQHSTRKLSRSTRKGASRSKSPDTAQVPLTPTRQSARLRSKKSLSPSKESTSKTARHSRGHKAGSSSRERSQSPAKLSPVPITRSHIKVEESEKETTPTPRTRSRRKQLISESSEIEAQEKRTPSRRTRKKDTDEETVQTEVDIPRTPSRRARKKQTSDTESGVKPATPSRRGRKTRSETVEPENDPEKEAKELKDEKKEEASDREEEINETVATPSRRSRRRVGAKDGTDQEVETHKTPSRQGGRNRKKAQSQEEDKDDQLEGSDEEHRMEGSKEEEEEMKNQPPKDVDEEERSKDVGEEERSKDVDMDDLKTSDDKNKNPVDLDVDEDSKKELEASFEAANSFFFSPPLTRGLSKRLSIDPDGHTSISSRLSLEPEASSRPSQRRLSHQEAVIEPPILLPTDYATPRPSIHDKQSIPRRMSLRGSRSQTPEVQEKPKVPRRGASEPPDNPTGPKVRRKGRKKREPSPVDDISLIPVIPEEEPVSTRSLRSKRGPSEEANVTQHNTRRGRKKSYKLW
ncbi:uncharacterized protein LOC111137601 isoform X2 [Crassostrea virginica]